MDPANQPSPYFIRRTVRPENQTIDLHEFSVVEDQIHPLRDYWLIVKRHRWLILSCALALFIAATLYTFTRTPLYTAEATLLIERKVPQILKLRETRDDSGDDDYSSQFYKTQYEILKSRALGERVVRSEGLESHPVFGGGKTNETAKYGLVSGLSKELKNWAKGFMPAKPATPNTQDPIPLSTQLAGHYLSMLEVRPVAGTSLVVIKFTTPDPALSTRLANAHASAYVRYGIDLRSQTNSEASEFLQEKLTELKERVQQSEAALNSYRKEKGIISVDDKSNVIIERLLDLNKGLTAAEGERIAWEAQVRAARGRNADEVPSVRNSGVIASLKAELGKFEAEYVSLAKEFKAGYPPLDNVKTRLEETRRRLNSEIDKEVKGIDAGFAAARNKETELRAAMEEQKKTTLNLKDSAVQYAILAREVDTNKQLYDGVLQRLKEIGVAADVRTSNIYLMGKALPPSSPSYPNKQRSMLLGLLLGLAAGIGLAFLLEQLDNTLKSPEEAERYLRLPSLAMVPDFASVNGTSTGYVSRLVKSAQAELPGAAPKAGRNTGSGVLLDHHPLSLVSEAYKSFRSALLLCQAGGPPHTILVTSAARGDGKTTTLVNTGIVFAQLGIRVLLIDADLRRPRCHMLLRMENSAGLSDLLAGQTDVETAIRSTPAENLFCISAGALPPNPAELLGSPKMHELLEQLRKQFEFIFVDSSPLLAVSDAVFLSTMVDGTLLVVNRRTPKPLVRKACARLTIPHSKILGMVLNRIDIHNNEYGGYYNQYHEYYSQDSAAITDNSSTPFENGNGRRSGKRRLNGNSPAASNPLVSKNARNGLSKGVIDLVRAKLRDAMGPMPTKLEELVKRISNEVLNDHRQHVAEEMFEEIQKTTDHDAPQPDLPVTAESAIAGKKANGKRSRTAAEKPAAILNPGVRQVAQGGSRPEFLNVVIDKMTEAMGPMASFVVGEHIRALGESTESFPPARLEDLVQRLSKEILSESVRVRFQEEMLKEIPKLTRPPTDSQHKPETGASVTSEKDTNGRGAHSSGEKPGITSDAAATQKSHEQLPSELWEIVREKLREAMGPMASFVLHDDIRALGETPESFPAARFEELVKQLSKEVLTDSLRQQFEKEMQEIRRSNKYHI